MKTKWFRRLLSSVLVVMLLFCSLPLNAFAVEGSVFTEIYHNYVSETTTSDLGTGLNGPEKTALKEAVNLTKPSVTAGQSFTPALPGKLSYELDTATFKLVRVMVRCISASPMDTYDTYFEVNDEGKLSLRDKEGSSMIIPEGAMLVGVYYIWERTAKEPEQPGGRPEIVTNVINSLTRTVAQKEKELSYKTQYGMDIYRVESKNDLTLTYSADMDMTKLGSSFFGANSWETLLEWYERITDETSVDLHFMFDKSIGLSKETLIDPASIDLASEMFIIDQENPYEIKEDVTDPDTGIVYDELTIHCRWDSANAKENMETNGKLDPMIELTGVKVALPADYWGDKDTIVIRNHGYVDGKVWAHRQSASSTGDLEWAEIDGGEKDDEFVLTTSDKVSLPGLEKKIIEDGEEKDNTSVNVKNDTVNFQLKSNVPEDLKELIEYTGTGEPDDVDVVGTIPEGEEYTLTFHDKMNSAFVVPEFFLVYLGDDMLDQTKLLELNKDYRVNFDPEDCTFEIQLDLVKLYNEGIIKDEDLGKTSITVSYNTKLKDTVTNGTFENEAWVTAGEWETSHDVVTVDTYQIDIHKFGNGQINTEPLAGAHFKLYQKVDGKEVIVEGCDDLISGEDGHVKVNGLKAGTYYLKETRAPDGYVCSDKEVEIKIPERANEENVVKVNFDNRSIPHTGGMGTTIFSIVGGVLIAMAGTVFVISRRKRRA